MAISETAPVHLPANAAARANRETLGCVLLFLFFVGLHTKLSIPSIPYLFDIFIATVILVTYFDRIPMDIIRWCIALSALGFVSMLVAPHAASEFRVRLPSWVFVTASLYCAGAACLLVRELKRESVASVVFFCLVVLTLGQILEQLSPAVRAISDHFSQWQNPEHDYEALTRDADMTLWINVPRPKFFTTEPSNLAKSMSMFIVLWYLFSDNKRKLLYASLMLVVAVLAGRSPTMVIGMGAISAAVFAEYIRNVQRKGRSLELIAFQLTLMFTVMLGALAAMLYFYQNRIQVVLAGQDVSTLLRLVVPMYLAYQVGLQYPVFGVGLGGKDTIDDMLVQALTYFHIPNLAQRIDTGAIVSAAGSSLFEMFISYGFVNTTIMIILLHWMRKDISNTPWLFYFPTLLAFSILGGAFENVYIWAVMFLFLQGYPKFGHIGERKPRRAAIVPQPALSVPG